MRIKESVLYAADPARLPQRNNEITIATYNPTLAVLSSTSWHLHVEGRRKFKKGTS